MPGGSAARASWKQQQLRLDPTMLVFIDETGPDRIGTILDTVTPEECNNYFRHAGYGSN